MAQLKKPVSVTNGSQAVTLTGNWAAQIKKTFIFMVEGELVPYTVAADAVYNAPGDQTSFTLTGAYQGTTNATANGVIVVDVTYPDLLPLIRQGDVGTAAIFTQAMYKLQAMIGAIIPGGLQETADAAASCQADKIAAAASAAASAASASQSAGAAEAVHEQLQIALAQQAVSLINTQAIMVEHVGFA